VVQPGRFTRLFRVRESAGSHRGDTVTIDLDKRVLDLEVPADELERRRAPFTAPATSGEKGWLSVYERTVGQLSEGATLRG
jgi:dihydroxy-acid dehydratase